MSANVHVSIVEARLSALLASSGQRPGRGSARGQIVMAADFDASMPEVEAAIEASMT